MVQLSKLMYIGRAVQRAHSNLRSFDRLTQDELAANVKKRAEHHNYLSTVGYIGGIAQAVFPLIAIRTGIPPEIVSRLTSSSVDAHKQALQSKMTILQSQEQDLSRLMRESDNWSASSKAEVRKADDSMSRLLEMLGQASRMRA